MDNIFEILVFGLFILINLIVSWFQKKKKEQEESYEMDENISSEETETRRSPLEELLMGTSDKTDVPNVYYEEPTEIETLYSEEKIRKAEESIKRSKERVEKIKVTKDKQKKDSIKNLLKDKNNLKNYILINEVLNKPKYFDY